MEEFIIGKGIGITNQCVSGQLLIWSDQYYDQLNILKDRIVYIQTDAHLFQIAILIDSGAMGIIFARGGKNYHPSIFLSDENFPAIAGAGVIDSLSNDQLITLDCLNGTILLGSKAVSPAPVAKTVYRQTKQPVYVNAGNSKAITLAPKLGADGIGLLRTEFSATRTLSHLLGEKSEEGISVKDLILNSCEADAIYKCLGDTLLKQRFINDFSNLFRHAVQSFPGQPVIIRTLDIPKIQSDSMGNRGIRRCISEGSHSIKAILRAIKKVQQDSSDIPDIGLIIPLVSSYNQIRTTLHVMIEEGFSLQGQQRSMNSIKFGWEIEQPAAFFNHELWMTAFHHEFGQYPHYIGIGTNDLTQFTLALGRDTSSFEDRDAVREYLASLYDEFDYSILFQIKKTSDLCQSVGTQLLLLGQIAADPLFAQMLFSYGIIPSVGIEHLSDVKQLAWEYEHSGSSRLDNTDLLERLASTYPLELQDLIKTEIQKHLT